MAAWASLSGYLYFKPSGGALSRLKSRKKLWCVLDESRGQLVYYKTEDDARCKAPLGYVELRGAAISLDLDNQNQFVIIVDGKEVYLTAENHESMMIWLLALQAKRDLFAKYEGSDNATITTATADTASTTSGSISSREQGVGMYRVEETRERVGGVRKRRSSRPSLPHLFHYASYTYAASASSPGQQATPQQQQQPPHSIRQRHSSTSSSDVSAAREGGHMTLCATKSLQYQQYANSGVNHNSQPIDSGTVPTKIRRQQLSRLGQTFDSGQTAKGHPEKTDRSRSLPPVLEEFTTAPIFKPFSRQMSASMESTELMRRHVQHKPYQSLFSNSSHDTNINFTNINFATPLTTTCVLESSSSGSAVDSDDVSVEEAGPGRERIRHASDGRLSSQASRSRGSSLSGSTDSALDKEDNCDLTTRVQDLEKELISTKCELAKVMNRQTCFQEILKQKDEIILDLDEKLSKLGGMDVAYDSKRRANQASKELQERIRVLQNQNRFLNEEVRRLARLRSQEQSKIKDQDGRVATLEGHIELWKLQYVSLIQSSIRFTGTDTMDDAELSLYGGDRHRNKVRALLDDARKVNPGLPTYENLVAGEVHVDYYGFKHQFQDCGLLLHYLCQELTQHYLTQAAAYEKHQQEWLNYLKNNAKCLLKNRKELKLLCRGGIPDQHRRLVWRSCIHDKVSDLMTEKGPHYFRSLCSILPDSPLAAGYRKQIGLDLMRTMPSNIKFSTSGSKGIMDLQDVLLAFCVHNPNVGYCQGMNFLVAMALLFLDAQDAFWTLVAVTERYHTASYFDQNLLGAQADQSVLRDLLADLLPDLARHLEAIDIEISTVTLNWFLAIFFDAVPFPTLLRVWDCFLMEGPKVLFRFSLAILKLHAKEIINKTETISVMRHLKACARVTYDVDGLVQLAFQGMKPFPRRQDISSKQMVYLKALKDKYRWRELQKLAFAERENLFLSLESETGSNRLSFECCTITPAGEVWVCYGNQSQCKVCVVDCKEGTMTDQPIQFSSRVMALCAVPEAILFGALSWNIFCYRTSDRTEAWEQQLHDAVLSLCQYDDKDSCRVFAGLADGTVAVLEEVSTETKFYDVMYIMIGQSPVTCLRLLDDHLWCACGNTVSLIHASTLDALDSFTVSSNPYDHILSLEPGLPGVWISVRGSSILELWDSNTLCCKMLYDTRAGRYPNLRKEDEAYFNRARITCILPLDYSVWVGTGEGNLITYDVFTHQGSKTPSDTSSFVGSYTDSCSALVGKEEKVPLLGPEGFDPVREAALRVRQLYLSQQQSEDEASRMSCLAVSTSSTLVNNSRESASHENINTAASTTLSARDQVICDRIRLVNDSIEERSRDEHSQKNEIKSEKDVKAPGEGTCTLVVVSPGEESEGITPTASFICQNSTSSSAGEDMQLSNLTDKEANDKQRALEVSNSTDVVSFTPDERNCNGPVTGEIGMSFNSSQKSVLDISSVDSSKTASQTEQHLERLRPKAGSPKNGLHMFYLGEELVSTLPGDGQDSVTDKRESSVCVTDNITNKKNSSTLPGDGQDSVTDMRESSVCVTDNITNKKNSSEENIILTGNRTCTETLPSQKTECNDRCDDRCDQQEEQRTTNPDKQPAVKSEEYECPTSESGVEMGSSDSSVIMQMWEAFTGKSRSSSRDSQVASQTASCREDQADPAGRKITLKASLGSSFTSSVESRQSESDEVFQDVNDQASNSTEDESSTAVTTAIEESQYETGHDETPTRDNSCPVTGNQPVVKQSGSCTVNEGDGRTAHKKRPQSLFINRSNKSHKWSGSCVDKYDPRYKGKFIVGSPPTPPPPGSHSTSLSSLNTQSSESMNNLQPADPEAQYRLDYTNLHVESDLDSQCTDDSMDSRRSSSVFSDGKSDAPVNGKPDGWQEDEGGKEEDLGLRMLDCDPSTFIFPQDMYNLNDGNGSVGRAMLDSGEPHLMHTPYTPSVSGFSCRTWSSYDEVSTPSALSCAEPARIERSFQRGIETYLPRNSSQLSTTLSIASTTDLLYAADMTLMSKNKISDKPVKCLLHYKQEDKPLLLSFSGCHSDDEAVLKWNREKDQMLWTNDPILEYNPATKTTKLPSYMKARLSSSSSDKSLKPRLSQGSQ